MAWYSLASASGAPAFGPLLDEFLLVNDRLFARARVSYAKGKPKALRRSDLDNLVTREFCGERGTQLMSR